MEADEYLNERVDDQLGYYAAAATKNKWRFTLMQGTVIVLGLLVPVVINLPETLGATQLRISATIMSVTLAIISGFLNFQKPGDLWLQYRMTEELLKHEKFMFLTKTGKYKASDAYDQFVPSVESIISAEHNKFRSLIEEARRRRGPSEGQLAPGG